MTIPLPDSVQRMDQVLAMTKGFYKRGHHRMAMHRIEVFLAAGLIHEARALAPTLKKNHAAIHMAKTGLSSARRDAYQNFIPDVTLPGVADLFPGSLPMLFSCVRAIVARPQQTRFLIPVVEKAFAELKATDRQQGLAFLAPVRYVSGTLREGQIAVNAIRHKNRRSLAAFLVCEAALIAGEPADAEKMLASISCSHLTNQAYMAIAGFFFRQGDATRANGFLCRVSEELKSMVGLLQLENALDQRDYSNFVETFPTINTSFGDPKDEPPYSLFGLNPKRWCRAGIAFTRYELYSYRKGERPHGPAAILNCQSGPGCEKKLLSAADQDGIDPYLLFRTFLPVSRQRADTVLAQHLAWRIRNVLRQIESGVLSCPVEITEPVPSNPLSPLRASYDEALGLTDLTSHRRAVLVKAARPALRATLAGSPERVGFETRLGSLTYLGGEHVRRLLEPLLQTNPKRRPVWDKVLQTLIRVNPGCGAQVLLRAECLFPLDAGMRELVMELIMHEAVDADYLPALDAIREKLEPLLGNRTDRWLNRTLSQWTAKRNRVPAAFEIEFLSELCKEATSIPYSGMTLLLRAESRLGLLVGEEPSRFVAQLAGDEKALNHLVNLKPAILAPSTRIWSKEKWRDALEALQRAPGSVCKQRTRQLARLLCGGKATGELVNNLVLGRFPVPAGQALIPLPGLKGFRLHYLDKRQDFAAFLRFADHVKCCFNSTSFYYRYSMKTRQWVMALWKDPLSFCFLIEDGMGMPQGFVFGGFGLMDSGQAALVLNGIYLRKQRGPLRFAVLEAIERGFATPLNLKWIAIANEYGGQGPMPDAYKENDMELIRLRALAGKSGLVTEIYDDISERVNTRIRLNDAYWRNLGRERRRVGAEENATSKPGCSTASSPRGTP